MIRDSVGDYTPVRFEGSQVHLSVPPGLAECEWTYQWQTNGVAVPNAIQPSLAVPNPLPVRYSIVISNCLGAVTNQVAQFIRLAIIGGQNHYYLSNATPTTDPFVIEATNRAANPFPWPPFIINGISPTLPVLLELEPPAPDGSVSSRFFRARPAE